MKTKINMEIINEIHDMTTSDLLRQVLLIGSTDEYGTNSFDIPRLGGRVAIRNGKDLYDALDTCYELISWLSEKISGELYGIRIGNRELFSRELKESLDYTLETIESLEEIPIDSEDDQ